MTKVINFADLIDPPKLVLNIAGVQHEMVEPSLESMLLTVQDLEKLGDNPDARQEIEVGLNIISRAFPTIPRADMMKWTGSQIQKMVEVARTAGAEVASAEAPTEGNGPKAS